MTEVYTNFKQPKGPKSKGRARPDEPLADHCELGGPSCTIWAYERHHILRRAQGGSDEKSNTMDLCWMCHNVTIHGNPDLAYERGWLKRRGAA